MWTNSIKDSWDKNSIMSHFHSRYNTLIAKAAKRLIWLLLADVHFVWMWIFVS